MLSSRMSLAPSRTTTLHFKSGTRPCMARRPAFVRCSATGSRTDKLKELLKGREILLGPCCHDGLSARLIEQAGFPFAFMSGFSTSAARLGSPDTGLISYAEMVDSARNIVEATRTLPVIGDGDTGYGNAVNVKRTVRGYAQAGLAGILIEDQVSPKSCGHVKNKKVLPRDEAVAKIRAAVDARNEGADILIVARTDARQAMSLDEALARVSAFAAAGADVLFIDALESEEEMRLFCQIAPGVAKMANMLEGGGRTPFLTPTHLSSLGFSLVSYPLSLLGVSIAAMNAALEGLKTGTVPPRSALGSFEEIQQAVGFQEYYSEEARYATGPAPPQSVPHTSTHTSPNTTHHSQAPTLTSIPEQDAAAAAARSTAAAAASPSAPSPAPPATASAAAPTHSDASQSAAASEEAPPPQQTSGGSSSGSYSSSYPSRSGSYAREDLYAGTSKARTSSRSSDSTSSTAPDSPPSGSQTFSSFTQQEVQQTTASTDSKPSGTTPTDSSSSRSSAPPPPTSSTSSKSAKAVEVVEAEDITAQLVQMQAKVKESAGGAGAGGAEGAEDANAFRRARTLRLCITDTSSGMVKLETRVPAGFLAGLSALIPQAAGLNLEALMEKAMRETLKPGKPIVNQVVGNDNIQIFLE